MNSISLVGRLLSNPLYKEGETNSAKFTLAINNGTKNTYIPCVAFGRTATIIASYFKKGSRIGIEGEIRSNNPEKLTDLRIEINAKKVYFIDKKGEGTAEDEYDPIQDVADSFGW